MEQILLTDEEMFYIGMSLTGGGGTYADILAVMQASAQAQLKKVHGKIEAMTADGYYLDDILEALLKEIE